MPFSYGLERLEPAFEDRNIPYIAYGSQFPEACAQHVEYTVGASRVYIIASKSLSTNTSALTRLQKALGDKVVGTRVGLTSHTLWSELLETINTARPLDPDCIVTLGAGSITDGSKIIAWALANGVSTIADLEALSEQNPNRRTDWVPPTLRVVCIPTSLSGGEYQSVAGATHDETHEKRRFSPPVKNPSLVILDPALTISTPESVWISSGVRSIDHCVEALCSLQSKAQADESAEKGLRILVPGLLRCKRDPDDLDARFDCMMGVVRAMEAVGVWGVPMGASHAIGHQLGPLGVGHGETSCVMLPAVCKWNWKEDANRDRQTKCKELLLRDQEVQKLMQENKLDESKTDLGDVLDLVIRALGMPRSLTEVGVGADKLDALALSTLKDHWILTNPKPITEKGQVLEILEMVLKDDGRRVKLPGAEVNGRHHHGHDYDHDHDNAGHRY